MSSRHWIRKVFVPLNKPYKDESYGTFCVSVRYFLNKWDKFKVASIMKHRIEIENKIVQKLFSEFDVCERS